MHSCRFFVSRCILPFIDCVILDFLWSIDSCFLSTKVSTKRTHSTWSSDTAANVEHGVLQTTDKTMKEKQKCNATFTPFTHFGVWHWPWRFKFCLTLTLWKEDGIIGGSNCLITKIISATSWLHLPAKKEETSSLQLPERCSKCATPKFIFTLRYSLGWLGKIDIINSGPVRDTQLTRSWHATECLIQGFCSGKLLFMASRLSVWAKKEGKWVLDQCRCMWAADELLIGLF